MSFLKPDSLRNKATGALVPALVLLFALNAWIGARLDALLQESSIDALLEIDRRVKSYPHKEAVKVLIFGNSHAVADLRPPQIAKALHLKADEVFSLALPLGTAEEMRLLSETYLSEFPNAGQAICSVDEFFVTWVNEVRLRYLSRFSVARRYHFASQAPTWEARFGLMSAMAFPLLDFNVPLREAFAGRPLLSLRRLLGSPALAGSPQAKASALDYPWGYPPLYGDPRVLDVAKQRADSETFAYRYFRATNFNEKIERAEQGLGELEALADTLQARGISLTVSELPSEPGFRALVEHLKRPHFLAYQKGLAGLIAHRKLPLVPAPQGWEGPRYFCDTDHLTPKAAQQQAEWLAAHLTRSR